MTPADFEARYGIPAKRLRAHLRKTWLQHPEGDAWWLNKEMVADACRKFGKPEPL